MNRPLLIKRKIIMPNTRTIRITGESFGPLDEAAAVLKNGGLVVFPTETVYGIGANANDEKAVRSIFTAKGRPQDNPLIVHIADEEQLSGLAENVPDTARILFDAFSPGPLTIVLKKKPSLPDSVTAGLDTVAVRIPSNPVARELLKRCAFPVAAPSANTSGRPSPTSYDMAFSDMNGKADIIIDGGNCEYGLESTVVSLNPSGKTVTVLRPGAVTAEMIREALKGKGRFRIVSSLRSGKTRKARSPGTKYAHYQPKARVIVMKNPTITKIKRFLLKKKGKRTALLHFRPLAGLPEQLLDIRFHSPAEYARKLYQSFHDLDRLHADIILAEAIPEKGIGIAVMNRLEKASGGRKA